MLHERQSNFLSAGVIVRQFIFCFPCLINKHRSTNCMFFMSEAMFTLPTQIQFLEYLIQSCTLHSVTDELWAACRRWFSSSHIVAMVTYVRRTDVIKPNEGLCYCLKWLREATLQTLCKFQESTRFLLQIIFHICRNLSLIFAPVSLSGARGESKPVRYCVATTKSTKKTSRLL